MMKPDCKMPIHKASKFSWEGRCGITDASDLSNPIWSRVWRDACDWGFQVESDNTGKVITFVLTKENQDFAGDIASWVFKSIIDEDPITIEIFNN